MLSVRLPLAVYAHWEAAARRRGRTISEHVREKLVEAVALASPGKIAEGKPDDRKADDDAEAR